MTTLLFDEQEGRGTHGELRWSRGMNELKEREVTA